MLLLKIVIWPIAKIDELINFTVNNFFKVTLKLCNYYSFGCALGIATLVIDVAIHSIDSDYKPNIISSLYDSFDLTALTIIVAIVAIKNKTLHLEKVLPFIVAFMLSSIFAKLLETTRTTWEQYNLPPLSTMSFVEDLFSGYVYAAFFVSMLNIAWWMLHYSIPNDNQDKEEDEG